MIKKCSALLLAVALLAALAGCSESKAGESGIPLVMPGDELTYQGETYHINEDLTTILVMGLDKYERPEQSLGFTNQLQADFLMLLVMDPQANTCEVLHLNRDTMTEIRSLGIGGGTAGKFQGQLALAHTYGSGGSDSCLNAVRAVSDMLGGVPIDHYMTLTMEAVGILNDLAGGVAVTVLEDMTSVDPALEKGAEVTLKGDQALTYVRSRKDVGDQSNLGRMERQRQYLTALFRQLMDQKSGKDTFLADALLRVSDYFVSDCTVDRLDQLADQLEQCEIDPIRTLKGEAKVGEEFVEFYVDQDDLMKTVISLFYKKSE